MFLQASLESIEGLSKRQKEVNNEILAKQSKSNRDPEIRVSDVDGNGKIELIFTQEIELPSNFAEIVNNRTASINKIQIESLKESSTESVQDEDDNYLQLMVRDPETGGLDENLQSYAVTYADSKKIVIQMKFYQPLKVS